MKPTVGITLITLFFIERDSFNWKLIIYKTV